MNQSKVRYLDEIIPPSQAVELYIVEMLEQLKLLANAHDLDETGQLLEEAAGKLSGKR